VSWAGTSTTESAYQPTLSLQQFNVAIQLSVPCVCLHVTDRIRTLRVWGLYSQEAGK